MKMYPVLQLNITDDTAYVIGVCSTFDKAKAFAQAWLKPIFETPIHINWHDDGPDMATGHASYVEKNGETIHLQYEIMDFEVDHDLTS